MEEEQTPTSVQEPPVAGFTMLQAEQHYNRMMVEVEQEDQASPVSVFWLLQEEQRYNVQLLEKHRLAEDQIEGEQAFD